MYFYCDNSNFSCFGSFFTISSRLLLQYWADWYSTPYRLLMVSHYLQHEVWKSLAWNTRVFFKAIWPHQNSPAPISVLLPFYSWPLPLSYTPYIPAIQNFKISLKIPGCLKSLWFSICFFCLKWLFLSFFTENPHSYFKSHVVSYCEGFSLSPERTGVFLHRATITIA